MRIKKAKPIVITAFEWKILFLFAVGQVVQYSFLKLSLGTLLAFYIFGMFFEFTTEAAWEYNALLYRSTFTVRDRDVNWIYGLGWQATLILALSLGRLMESAWHFRLTNVPAWLFGALGLFVVGNILEQTFLAFGLYRYNPRHWIVTLWTKRPVEILGIPVAVRLGYFVMGILIFFLAQWTGTWGCRI